MSVSCCGSAASFSKSRDRSSLRFCLLVACLLFAATGAGCSDSDEAPGTRSPKRPAELRHIVLISIDTLRADYLACYGHPYVQTPNIDALAETGFLFERHVASAPTTLASHTALMTGTWPHSHGAPRNGFIVDSANNMLAEVLQEHGFSTAGFIGAFPLSQRFAFNQGFDHWDEKLTRPLVDGVLETSERPANEVTDAALAWSEQKARKARAERREGGATDERIFLFVHYFDVHAPYTPPRRFDRMYRKDRSDVTGSLQDVYRARQEFAAGLPTALNDQLKQQYAAEVSWIDSEVGRLLDGLKEQGILDDALVVLTSDHGEAMDEHWEYWNHGYSTYRETTHTPLIIQLPGGQPGGRRVQALVSNIDVMPTLLELFSVTQPIGVEGISFAGALGDGPFTPIRDIAYSEATKPFGETYEGDPVWTNARKPRSAETARWKIVHRPSDYATELYDLEADPAERNDLYRAERERARALEGRLEAWGKTARPKQTVIDVDPDTRARLESLGYGGSAEPQE